MNSEHEALYRNFWARMHRLCYLDSPASRHGRLRLAVASSYRGFEPDRLEPFLDGSASIDMRDGVGFVAHQHGVPVGYLTGEDREHFRDENLERELAARMGAEKPPLPDWLTEAANCSRSVVLERSFEPARAAVRHFALRRILFLIVWNSLMILCGVVLMVTSWFTGGGWLWGGPIILIGVLVVGFFDIRKIRHLVRITLAPADKAGLESDMLIKEQLGHRFGALRNSGEFEDQWFHDTFCHDLPISQAAMDRLPNAGIRTSDVIRDAVLDFARTPTLAHEV